MCVYDMALGGMFCNFFGNEAGPCCCKDQVMELCSPRLTKYVKDFMQEMKPYLDSRPKCPM